MTVSYSGNYALQLLRWKGGLIRTLWKELAIYFFLFFCTRLFFQYGTGKNGSTTVGYIQIFRTFVERIPIIFLVATFAASTLFRWQKITKQLNWPDYLILLINANFPGKSKEESLKRHTIARYLALCQLLVYRDISTKVRSRFPRLIEVANSGMMTFDEYSIFQKISCKYLRWQLPLQWIVNGILNPSPSKVTIPMSHTPQASSSISAESMDQILNEISSYRKSLFNLYLLNWINFPFIYVQTAVVVVYGYFGLCLVGHQTLGDYAAGRSDTLIPWLTLAQFLIYIGLLKMCQKLWRPFGDDHDDLELNYLLDRNTQTAMYASQIVPHPIFSSKMEDSGWPAGPFWAALPTKAKPGAKGVTKNREPKMYAMIELEGRHGVELWERKIPGQAWKNLLVDYSDDPNFVGMAGSTQRLSVHF